MTNVIKLETTLLRRGYTVAELRAAVAKIAAAYAAAVEADQDVRSARTSLMWACDGLRQTRQHCRNRRGAPLLAEFLPQLRAAGRYARKAQLAVTSAEDARQMLNNQYYELCQKVQRQNLLLGEYAIEVGGGYL